MSAPPVERGGRGLFAVTLAYAVVEVSQAGAVALEHGVPSPWLVTQLLAVGALAAAASQVRLAWSPVLTAAFLVLGVRLLSTVTAVDREAALDATVEVLRDTFTIVVLFVLLITTGRHRSVIAACTVALALLAGVTVVQELLGNTTELGGLASVTDAGAAGATTLRHAGPVGDPNFWARVLVMFLPFALAFGLVAPAGRRRWGWGVAVVVLLAGIWLTQSRGGMLAAAAAVVVMLAVAGARYRRWLMVLPVVAAVVLLLPATGKRLATLGDVFGGGAADEAEESLLLRGRAIETSLRMIEDRPLLGVGTGNYAVVAPRVERELAVEHLGQIEQNIAPHNTFLEAAAETGLPGLAVFLVFLGTVGVVAGRALLVTRPLGGRPAGAEHLLAAAALGGVAGWVTASLVLHLAQYRTLLVFAALVAALDVAVTGETAPRPAAPARARRPVAPIPLVVGGVLLLAVVVAAGRSQTDLWRARGTVAVVPRESQPSILSAYEYELLSRPGVMRTLGRLVADPALARRSLEDLGLDPDDFTVRAQAKSTSSVLHVVVEGEPRRDVTAALAAVTDRGIATIAGLDQPYVASPAGRDSVERITQFRAGWTTWALLAAAGAWWAWALALGGLWRARAPGAAG